MPAPRKYPDELRQRAIRMVLDAKTDPDTARGAIRRVADQLGISRETLRGWVRRTEIDNGQRPGTTTDDTDRIHALEKENRELPGLTRSSDPPRLFSRRSSTAPCADLQIHQLAQGRLWGRGDLPGTTQRRCEDHPVHLLRTHHQTTISPHPA